MGSPLTKKQDFAMSDMIALPDVKLFALLYLFLYFQSSTIGVGMGVAMMMQNAGMMVTQPPPMDQNAIRGEIRKAKAEGRTVTIVNGGLYFDYHLVARVPPNFDIRV